MDRHVYCISYICILCHIITISLRIVSESLEIFNSCRSAYHMLSKEGVRAAIDGDFFIKMWLHLAKVTVNNMMQLWKSIVCHIQIVDNKMFIYSHSHPQFRPNTNSLPFKHYDLIAASAINCITQHKRHVLSIIKNTSERGHGLTKCFFVLKGWCIFSPRWCWLSSYSLLSMSMTLKFYVLALPRWH